MPDVDLRIRISADGSATLVKTKEGLEDLEHGSEGAHGALERLQQLLEGNVSGALEGLAHSSGAAAVAVVGLGVAGFELAEKFADTFNALQNLHVATGLNVATLGAWKETAAVTGVSADSMASSMQKLGAQIESGSQKAVDGARLLGISFEQLEAAAPDERLDMIASAVAKVGTESDTAQAAVKDLFGKGGLGLLPALSEDAVQYREHIHELVTSILGDEATAASQAKEWKESVNTVEVAFESVLQKIGQGIAAAPKLAQAYGLVAEAGSHYNTTTGIWEKGPAAGGQKAGMTHEQLVEQEAHENNLRVMAQNAQGASQHAKMGEGLSVSAEQGEEYWKKQDEAAAQYAATLVAISKGMDDYYAGIAHSNGVRLDQSLLGPNPDDLNIQMGRLASQVENVGGAGALTDAQLAHTVTTLENLRNTGGDNAYALGILADAEGEASDRGLQVGDTYATISGSAKQLAADHHDLAHSMKAAFADSAADLAAYKEHIDEIAHSWENVGSVLSGIGSLAGGKGGSALGAAGGLAGGIGGLVKGGGFGQIFGGGGEDENGDWVADSGMQTAMKLVGAVAKAIPIAGAAIGVVKSLASIFGGPSEEEKIGKDLGDHVSDGLIKAIKDTEEKSGVSRTLAEMLNVDAIFKETGQTNRIFDLMNATKLGAVDAKAGIDELGKAFTDLKTSADGGSVSSEAAMVKMIQRAKELGEHIPALDAAMKGFADDAQKNLADFIGGQGTGKDKKISATQAGADSQVVGDVFALESSQNGVVAAAEAMQESIAALVAKLPAGSALTGGAAEAAYYGELAKNEDYKGANKTAVAAAHIDKDLIDSGFASQATTEAFSTTAVSSYQQAYGAAGGPGGGDQARKAGEEAVLPLLAQLQKDQALGIKISPDAKNLLAQANKDGMLPALDVATQSLVMLKQIAENTGGVPAATPTDTSTTADTIPVTSTTATTVPKNYVLSGNGGFAGSNPALDALGGLPAAQDRVKDALAGVAGNTKETNAAIAGVHDAIKGLPTARDIGGAVVSALRANGF